MLPKDGAEHSMSSVAYHMTILNDIDGMLTYGSNQRRARTTQSMTAAKVRLSRPRFR